MNNSIFISKAKQQLLKPLADGAGSYGKCYFLDDKTLLKKFYDDKDETYKPDDIMPLLNISNSSYVFPKSLVFDEYQFVGYTMRYINAKSIFSYDGNYSLKRFIKAIPQVEKDTLEISKKGIYINDLSPTNILFNNKRKITIIDVDNYQVFKEGYMVDCYHDNIGKLHTDIFYMIGKNSQDPTDHNLKDFINDHLEIFDNSSSFSNALITLVEQIEKYTLKEIETKNDLHRVLR